MSKFEGTVDDIFNNNSRTIKLVEHIDKNYSIACAEKYGYFYKAKRVLWSYLRCPDRYTNLVGAAIWDYDLGEIGFPQISAFDVFKDLTSLEDASIDVLAAVFSTILQDNMWKMLRLDDDDSTFQAVRIGLLLNDYFSAENIKKARISASILTATVNINTGKLRAQLERIKYLVSQAPVAEFDSLYYESLKNSILLNINRIKSII